MIRGGIWRVAWAAAALIGGPPLFVVRKPRSDAQSAERERLSAESTLWKTLGDAREAIPKAGRRATNPIQHAGEVGLAAGAEDRASFSGRSRAMRKTARAGGRPAIAAVRASLSRHGPGRQCRSAGNVGPDLSENR